MKTFQRTSFLLRDVLFNELPYVLEQTPDLRFETSFQ